MKILAVRFARLGDAILLLPALSALKASFPGSHVTFLTGQPCAPIGEMCPAVDEVISIDRLAMRDGPVWTALLDMKRLMSDLRQREFDLAIDFHSFRETNLLVGFSGAKKRLGMKRYNAPYLPFCFNLPPVLEDKSIHVMDMFLRIVKRLGDGYPAARNISLPPDAERWAAHALPSEKRVSVYVDSSGPDKSWPAERFAAVVDFAVEKLKACVAVLSGKDGTSAQRVQMAVRSAAGVTILPNLPLSQMAAVIASSQLLLSNDTGPMHLGPTLGVPTLGLFSVGLPEHFRPRGPFDRVLCGNPIELISVDSVIEAAEQMWITTADPNLRR